MAEDALLSEMVKRAAVKHADTLDRTAPPKSKGEGKLPWLAYLAGLAADVGTTAYGAHKGLTEEANPLMKWAGKNAAPVVAGSSLGGMLLMRKLFGQKHPGAMKGMLYGMGGAHGLAAAGNVGQMNKARQEHAAPANEKPPRPGMVRMPDGSWIDPDYFK